MASDGEVLSSSGNPPKPGNIPEESNVWAAIARHYTAFTSPMIPGAEDIGVYERSVAAYAADRMATDLKAVILGVTPSIATMKWPSGTSVTAVEISQPVIEALWPGDIPNVREARCASWFSMPVGRNSCDVVIGDGSMIACRYPAEAKRLIHYLGECLVDGGILVLRVYIRPERQETVPELFNDLLRQKMRVDVFKFRLYLAMQRTVEEGVQVRIAANILEEYRLNRQEMISRCGWPEEVVEPFAMWRKSNAVYSFPALQEFRDLLGGAFSEVSVTYPTYELGNLCPIFVLRSCGRPL